MVGCAFRRSASLFLFFLRVVIGKPRTRQRRENAFVFHLSPPRGESECEASRFVVVSGSEAIQGGMLGAQVGSLRRGACQRAGHFGPDPLAPRDDETCFTSPRTRGEGDGAQHG